MGANQQTLPNLRWHFVKRDERYEIYQSDTGEVAEKHLVENNPKLNEAEEMDMYCYRNSTNKPIVRVYKVEYQINHDICSNAKNIEVYSEYIPFRLVDVCNLTHEQGLYVLSEALLGFYELYNKLGAFPVDHSLVGFNKDGKVRVWHSPNFAKNRFDKDTVVLMSTTNPHNFDERLLVKQEEEMMMDIWNTVDSHTHFNPVFRENITLIKEFNFKVVKQVVDQYVLNSQFIPAKLKFQDRSSLAFHSHLHADSSRYSQFLQNSTKFR